jgi:hypothetical protein
VSHSPDNGRKPTLYKPKPAPSFCLGRKLEGITIRRHPKQRGTRDPYMRRLNTIFLVLILLTGARAIADDHWAFQPIPPARTDLTIDALLDRRLAANDLKPQAAAPKDLLLRRVHLDLTGLVPSATERAAFLADVSSDAYERVVNRLLASPQYGERWGRHWMDVWRYSDGYGLGKQLRVSSHHLWHWRDWIINSLNTDKGYDAMIVEMLAGDELVPTDPDILAATGFLARNYYLFNRTTWLDNTLEHTGKAFLGMTFNCVKCHDHKYDPIPHEDYYRLRAVFEPHQVRLDAVRGELDFDRDGLPRVFDDHLEAETHLHLKGDEKTPDTSRLIQPGVPAALGGPALNIRGIPLPAFAFAPGTRAEVTKTLLAAAETRLTKARARLAKARSSKPTKSETGSTQISDDFSRRRDDLWVSPGPDWQYRDGLLSRDTAGRSGNLISKFSHPKNFTANLRFQTTGGDTYKSVGIRFDATADSRQAHMVYASAHGPGPKVQVAHITAGKSSYPATGRVSRQIATGRLYDLEIRVRDQLLNVYLDGGFLLAYSLPERFESDRIELTAFDATVEFRSFLLRTLPDSTTMASPGETTPQSADPEREPRLAELDVARRESALESLRLRIAADQAALIAKGDDNAQSARVAAQAEARQKITENEYLLAELNESNADFKKLKNQYEAALKTAQKKLTASGTDYTPIPGSRKALETPEHKTSDYAAVYPRSSTGRRLALARWITHAENPLTARVAVNHIWMRHFGTPLVDSVFDFGLRAPEPLHRDLLDSLAAGLIADGWSMKALHKRILLSSAYRRSSSNLNADSETFRQDPDNHHYWRMNPRRMESQLVRDNLLHLTDSLDPAIGGPSLDPEKASRRRSLYFRHSRDDAHKFVAQFDDADFLQCYRRAESVVPQQALALANSELALSAAHQLAEIGREKTDAAYVKDLFTRILGRTPGPEEFRHCEAFLKDPGENRPLLAHALLNHNDFVTIR